MPSRLTGLVASAPSHQLCFAVALLVGMLLALCVALFIIIEPPFSHMTCCIRSFHPSFAVAIALLVGCCLDFACCRIGVVIVMCCADVMFHFATCLYFFLRTGALLPDLREGLRRQDHDVMDEGHRLD